LSLELAGVGSLAGLAEVVLRMRRVMFERALNGQFEMVVDCSLVLVPERIRRVRLVVVEEVDDAVARVVAGRG
jgi:hypothetical protein